MDWNSLDIRSVEAGTELLIARPAFVMQGYGGDDLNAHAANIFATWRARVPSAAPLHYVDFDARRFRKLTPKALERVNAMLGSATHEFQYFFFKDAPDISLGQHSLELMLGPSKTGAMRINMAWPVGLLDRPDLGSVIDTFCQWVDAFPVAHASAGYGFDYTVGREHEQEAQPAMMRIARRYLGFDVRDRLTETKLRDRVKGPAWLNYLSAPLLERAGGAAAMDAMLSPAVRRIACRNGVLLVAGERPTPGDTNRQPPELEAMRDVAELLKPIRLQRWVQDDVLSTFGFDDAHRWFSRLDRS